MHVVDPIYTRSEGEAHELCEALHNAGHRILGFGINARVATLDLTFDFLFLLFLTLSDSSRTWKDIEWKVTFEAGVTSRQTATIQLSTALTAYVMQVSAMKKILSSLIRLLEDPTILKVGCKVCNDALKVRRDFGIRTRGLVDLSKLASRCLHYGERPWSLADLVVETTGRQLPKDLRMSDWESSRLTAEQLTYAARDAFASRLVCVRMLSRLELEHHQTRPTVPPLVAESEESQLLRRIPAEFIEDTPVDPVESRRIAASE